MKEFVLSEATTETAVLVGLITPQQDEATTNEYLDELAFLAATAGARVVRRFTQRLPQAFSTTYVGRGKLEEIKEYIALCSAQARRGTSAEGETPDEVGMVIFDDELSPRQLRIIEATLKVKILDRTSLILDIFALRARTAEAKTQVELAQNKYMLPRLQRLWTHLERQGASAGTGTVGLRGPGETQLELDRRLLTQRIALLTERLKEIDRQRTTQRSHRGRLIRVALVGYTNVGKSTLMNVIAKSNIIAEDKLFATLDTTVRKVVINNLPFLLADTVGFIRKLPTDLIEAFKSTLDETRLADLLVHIVDISHPAFEEQFTIVNNTLRELGCADKPQIVVFNKIDKYRWTAHESDDLTPVRKDEIPLAALQETWMARLNENCIFISATQRENIDTLKTMLYQRVRHLHVQKYPHNDFLYPIID